MEQAEDLQPQACSSPSPLHKLNALMDHGVNPAYHPSLHFGILQTTSIISQVGLGKWSSAPKLSSKCQEQIEELGKEATCQLYFCELSVLWPSDSRTCSSHSLPLAGSQGFGLGLRVTPLAFLGLDLAGHTLRDFSTSTVTFCNPFKRSHGKLRLLNLVCSQSMENSRHR
nr:uncharacterized protein LOC105489469 isoform X2 [Macaca nemestrina]